RPVQNAVAPTRLNLAAAQLGKPGASPKSHPLEGFPASWFGVCGGLNAGYPVAVVVLAALLAPIGSHAAAFPTATKACTKRTSATPTFPVAGSVGCSNKH